jgi:hypothetical protein
VLLPLSHHCCICCIFFSNSFLFTLRSVMLVPLTLTSTFLFPKEPFFSVLTINLCEERSFIISSTSDFCNLVALAMLAKSCQTLIYRIKCHKIIRAIINVTIGIHKYPFYRSSFKFLFSFSQK